MLIEGSKLVLSIKGNIELYFFFPVKNKLK
jgi:hypothetical protein